MEMYYFFIWFLIIFSSYFIILFAYLHFSNKKEILNNIISFFALFFVFIHVLMFLLLMFQDSDLHKFTMPLFLDAILIPLFLVGLGIIISTFALLIFRVILRAKDFSMFKQKLTTKLGNLSKTRKDLFRKVWHIGIFIVLFILWYYSYDFVQTQMAGKKKKLKIEPRTTNTNTKNAGSPLFRLTPWPFIFLP